MGYSGGKISGHSRTEFKHRTVFKDLKRYIRKTNRFIHIPTGNQSSVKIYKYKEPSIFSRLFKAILVLSLFTFIFFISIKFTDLAIESIDPEDTKKEMLAIVNKEKARDKITFYRYYIRIGDTYYNSGDHATAQENYQRALEYIQNDHLVYEKFALCLSEQCYQDGKNCNRAKDYIKYVATEQVRSNAYINSLRSKVSIGEKRIASL